MKRKAKIAFFLLFYDVMMVVSAVVEVDRLLRYVSYIIFIMLWTGISLRSLLMLSDDEVESGACLAWLIPAGNKTFV